MVHMRWEFVPVLELLLHGLNDWAQRPARDIGSQHLLSCLTLAIEKLEEYLGKKSRSPAWLAAVVFNPKYKWDLLTSIGQKCFFT